MDPAKGPEEELDTLPGLLHHLGDAWERRNEPNVALVHYRDLTNDTGPTGSGQGSRWSGFG